jgi:hypothetical protein
MWFDWVRLMSASILYFLLFLFILGVVDGFLYFLLFLFILGVVDGFLYEWILIGIIFVKI